MALRWRKTGEILCAAKSEPKENDIYICDGLHYELSIHQQCIVPDIDEETNGLWYWLHGECSRSDHEDNARHQVFPVYKSKDYKPIYSKTKNPACDGTSS